MVCYGTWIYPIWSPQGQSTMQIFTDLDRIHSNHDPDWIEKADWTWLDHVAGPCRTSLRGSSSSADTHRANFRRASSHPEKQMQLIHVNQAWANKYLGCAWSVSELVSKTSVFVTLSLTVSRIPADEMPGHTSHGRLWLWISASQFADEREDSTLYYETVWNQIFPRITEKKPTRAVA